MSGQHQLVQYHPPKSSVWGHATGKLRPEEFRRRVDRFLNEAAATFETGQHSLVMTTDTTAVPAEHHSLVATLVAIVPPTPDAPQPHSISAAEFDRCLAAIDAAHTNSKSMPALLMRAHFVAAWKLQPAAETEPKSMLIEYYGQTQRLSTHLWFSSLDEYRWVKEKIRLTIGIELNDKHLLPKSIRS